MNEQCDLSSFAIGTVASTPSIVSSKRNWIQEESTPFCRFFICVSAYHMEGTVWLGMGSAAPLSSLAVQISLIMWMKLIQKLVDDRRRTNQRWRA